MEKKGDKQWPRAAMDGEIRDRGRLVGLQAARARLARLARVEKGISGKMTQS